MNEKVEDLSDSSILSYQVTKEKDKELEKQKSESRKVKRERMKKKLIDETLEKGLPQYIRVNFSGRPFGQKILYLHYCFWKYVHYSIVFYFVPLLTIPFSYIIPFNKL